VHFCMLVWRQFVRNRCLVRASSLAYTTLLALIPLLAVIITISSALLKNKDEDTFYQAIASIAPPAVDVNSNSVHAHQGFKWTEHGSEHGEMTATNPAANFAADESTKSNAVLAVSNAMAEITAAGTNVPAVVISPGPNTNTVIVTTTPAGNQINDQKEVARWLRQFVQNTQGGVLGFTGLVAFAFISIMMLIRVEETFNDIWGITRGRNWPTRIFLYWGAITLGPVMILMAISISTSSHLTAVKQSVEQVPFGGAVLALVPLVLLWITFTIIYVVVPNTKVDFSAAAIGGIVAGTVWHLNNAFAFLYVSRVMLNWKMFGAIGLIPVLMVGLYFSWAILLLGAQVAYSYQNRAAYLQDKIAENVNQRGREFVALRIMTLLGQHFQLGLRPPTILQLSTELGVPSRLTLQVLRVLIQARLVTEAGRSESAFSPARPLDTINVHHVLLAMRAGAGQELPLIEAPALAGIYGEFTRIEAVERNAAERISLTTLVQRAPVTALVTPGDCESKREFINIPQIETIHLPLGDDGDPETARDPFLGTEAEKAMERAKHPEVPPTPTVETPVPASTQPSETSVAPEPAPATTEKSTRREPVQPEDREFPL
jgi:membrane protein